jgi:hypothetical protein
MLTGSSKESVCVLNILATFQKLKYFRLAQRVEAQRADRAIRRDLV